MSAMDSKCLEVTFSAQIGRVRRTNVAETLAGGGDNKASLRSPSSASRSGRPTRIGRRSHRRDRR
jgi:hypothetical protein